MEIKDPNTLLSLIESIQKKAPEYLDLLAAGSDLEYDTAFLKILDKAVRHLESNSKNFASLGEEGLTAALVGIIKIPGLTVTQESNSNGHVDLTVTADHCSPERVILGEAKIYGGPAYHVQGLGQLLNRYSGGREVRCHVIEYVRKADISGLFKKLRDHMDENKPHAQQGETDSLPATLKWSFQSRHKHSCGDVVDVGHIGCNMFAPSSADVSHKE